MYMYIISLCQKIPRLYASRDELLGDVFTKKEAVDG